MYLIRFLGIMAAIFSVNCYADYTPQILFEDGDWTYNTISNISPTLLPNIGDEKILEQGKGLTFWSGLTDFPSEGGWWGCYGGRTLNGNRDLGVTPQGYIKSGNDDYAFVVGNGSTQARCGPGNHWVSAPPTHTHYVPNIYVKLKRIAKTGDTSPIFYPRIFVCLMPSDREGSDASKCETYSSLRNDRAWNPDSEEVTPQPPPSACTAQVTTSGGPVIDNGTIQLETISAYGTIGVPPSILYPGKSFAIEPVNGPNENCQDFSTSKVTFSYDEVLSQGLSVIRSDRSDVGFVIKNKDTGQYVVSDEQMSFNDLEPGFKVNYWSLSPTAGAGAFNSGTVTIEIIYN
ncbi:hypothetical protein HB763_08090 [Vibrio campbellii]|uniref:hypothetical protein n=1 Tax=Vibrio campbellii TaxID=680 RepID=UPI00210BEC15|nr:hypothetical protein [Vibrio campbellii]UTZ36650.1 hypothetical protein HB763_08090 [Vibrio campbellii]